MGRRRWSSFGLYLSITAQVIHINLKLKIALICKSPLPYMLAGLEPVSPDFEADKMTTEPLYTLTLS